MAKIVKQVWLLQSESSAEYFASDFEPSPDNAFITVVGGPVSVEFDVPDVARCPHCNKALPETEKPKLPLLPLVVGGVYRTRGGNTVTLVSKDSDDTYPWNTAGGRAYMNDGRDYKAYETDSDLIERIA